MFEKKLSDWKTRNPGVLPNGGKSLYLAARQLSSPRRALPDFLVIGAQKSGSTSLFNYLSLHPQVLPAVQKEIFYFNNEYSRGENWYRQFFPLRSMLRRGGALTGEASTTYLNSPECAIRVRELIPDAKLIAVLRDPVERAISHYFHRRRTGRETRSLEDVFCPKFFCALQADSPLPAEDKLYFERGLYADHLCGWLEVFPSAQLKVVKAEDMFKDVNLILNHLHDYLGLKSHSLEQHRTFNPGQDKSHVPSSIRDDLRCAYSEANLKLVELLGSDFTWKECE